MKTSKLLLAIVGLLFLSVSCYRDNINKKPEWSKFFTEHSIDSACFEIYDNTHDQVFIYNKDRSSRRFSPASTFKIFNSLVALETNLAPDIDYVIKWDGKERWNKNWNQDLNMKEAFMYSALPYYQVLAKKIGKDTLQQFLDTIQYGNRTIGDSIDQFWIDGSLKITPDEQVGFLKKMYFDKLPLSKRSQRLVRTLMLQEKNDEYKLSYKTGTSLTENGYICQLVGYLEKIEVQKNVETKKEETNYRPYFFALNFETKDKSIPLADLVKIRVDVTKSIFKDLEIIE